jgi:hypothetical protein
MRHVLALLIVAVGSSACASESARTDEPASAAQNATGLRVTPVQPTGTGNAFTVLSSVGEPVSNGSSFTRSLTLGATYTDSTGYYASKPPTIHVVMLVTTRKVLHGSLDRPKSTVLHEFDITRESDTSYRGLLPQTIALPGGFGDHETVLDSVDVAFRAEGDRWDSNLGKNYHVVL